MASKGKPGNNAKSLLPANSFNFGKPKTSIQVGVEYQAEIPSLMKEYQPSELMRFGLPIPVTRVHDQPKTSNEEATDSDNASESAWVDGGKESNMERQANHLLPLPGLVSTETWSVIEHEGFLLGLYVFEKNFSLVKNFMESKGVGSIIRYYYGEFYKSCEYCRWSKWRKDRYKRPQNARKLFTGWSHDELLSRLSSNVTDVCKNHLMKAATKYIKGRLPLPTFIFTLEHNVGVNLLVEAVAIGREERDLMVFPEISNLFNIEVPIRNACSSLTPPQLLEILNGNVRLSKAKSSDLFWGAVWPRLLARGWLVKLPTNCVIPKSKDFVFLVPRVTEFSRKELKKGIHYFDSLIDVLSKVASEPELLELESDQDKAVNADTSKDFDDQEQLDYLQPDVPQSNQYLKYMIVDTSLDRVKDGIFKMMELTSSPVSEPAYIVEEGPDEQDVTESIQCVFGLPDAKSSTINKDLVDHLDPKSCQSYSESKPDDTSENDDFQEKTPSWNSKHEEIIKEQCLNNKHNQGIVIGQTSLPQIAPDLDSNQSSLSAKPTANQLEFSNAGANMMQQPILVPRRHSTRKRVLSLKGVEALVSEYLSPWKKRKGSEKLPRRAHGMTTHPVGARDVENAVDGEFSGATNMLDVLHNEAQL